jgi:hypothetical protein
MKVGYLATILILTLLQLLLSKTSNKRFQNEELIFMENSYKKRLAAILKMLTNPAREVKREGHDLLFNLWLENLDNLDFLQDLVPITETSVNLIQEFEDRINDIVIREKITDIYLRTRLKNLAKELENFREDDNSKKSILRIFISYSHRDEEFKEELITILAGLVRQKVIDSWQDRRITAGDDWFNEICKAMENCDIAVLLISSHFIASPFIQQIELTRLFQRRLEEGLRVVPIIVRPCLWQSEPAIKKLQVLPKDGKPVISYSQNNGERDQVWTDIGKVIEKFAREL